MSKEGRKWLRKNIKKRISMVDQTISSEEEYLHYCVISDAIGLEVYIHFVPERHLKLDIVDLILHHCLDTTSQKIVTADRAFHCSLFSTQLKPFN